MYDLLIRGATVADGRAEDLVSADVAVRGDRIAAVAPTVEQPAHEVIDGAGLLLTPGLIDPHSHSDWSVLGNRDAESTIRQGVTTEIVGNCGVTYAPLGPTSREAAAGALTGMGYDGPVSWTSFAELLERVHHQDGGTTQNLAWFVGHTALRDAAGIIGANVSPEQARTMRSLLDAAMAAGALGVSTGLEYGSGRDSTREELRSLMTVVGRREGMYASHIRNRDAGLADAVDEFLDVAARAGVRAQLSHLNVRYNTGAADNAWDDAVARLTRARDQGMPVLADMTPFPDGIGLPMGLLPGWLLTEGPGTAAESLSDPQVRRRVREDSDRYWRFVHRGEWDRVTLATSPATTEWEGLTLPEIAHQTGRDPWDCLLDVLQAAGPDMGSVQLIGRLFTEEHLAEAISHPLFCLGVDGFTSRLDGPLSTRTRHPLFFHGHAHYLAHHVLQKQTLTVADAVRKMTSMVADHFGLHGRGHIVEGGFADLALFDLQALERTDTAVFRGTYSRAARHVWVNGQAVIKDSQHLHRRPGRFLSRP